MLFQRLYNWIKYKVLPSSFLFKNRLFIERDTKHKKIYNLLGIVFRNSKWSNFELFNIKPQFKTKYSKTILICLFTLLMFLLFFTRHYFNFTFFTSKFNFILWLSYDAIDYYVALVVWVSIFVFYSILYWIYDYFLEKFLLTKYYNHNEKNESFFKFFNEKYKQKSFKRTLQKKDLKFLLYFWLNSNDFLLKEKCFEMLFNSKINTAFWSKNYIFFSKLFKVFYFCNLTNEKFTLVYLHLFLNKFFILNKNSETLYFIFNKFNYTTFYSFFIYLNFLNENSYFKKSNKFYTSFSLRDIWSFNQLHLESFNTFNFFNYSNSFFYLKNLNFNDSVFFQTTYKELNHVLYNFNNQIKGAKWNRWLYKYSILHRRILKNSHKLTISKRFLSSGFYNKSLIDKNTWASHRWTRLNSKNLTSLNHIFYPNLPTPNNQTYYNLLTLNSTVFTKQEKQINRFYNFENSFFWLIKRFYFFNTIKNNVLKSNFYALSPNLPVLSTITDSVAAHFFFINRLSSILYLNINELFFYTNFMNFNSFSNQSSEKNNSYLKKDLYLEFEEIDFFNNETLDISYKITLNSNLIKNNFFFNSYSSHKAYQYKLPIIFNEELTDFIFWENTDNLFLSLNNAQFDLFYFNLFKN